MKTKINIDEEILIKLYLTDNKTVDEIAEELNVPISQVDFYLNKYHIKRIVKKLEKVCPICGKRFEPNVHNQVCCSEECKRKLDYQRKRENQGLSVADKS